jgi:antitoxin (DNA-binding transcriptional repressor) of toxin-antitoxin stability system
MAPSVELSRYVTTQYGHIGFGHGPQDQRCCLQGAAQCLKLIDEVAESGQPLTVTKRGKAKVQIVAVREKPKTLIGALKGSFDIEQATLLTTDQRILSWAGGLERQDAQR